MDTAEVNFRFFVEVETSDVLGSSFQDSDLSQKTRKNFFQSKTHNSKSFPTFVLWSQCRVLKGRPDFYGDFNPLDYKSHHHGKLTRKKRYPPRLPHQVLQHGDT